jgi:hypothetical protein
MKEHQIERLRDAMRNHCVNEEVLWALVDQFHNFSHHLPYLWQLVEEVKVQGIYFNSLEDVSAFVADNW